jgi:hypothetical protein
MFRFPVLRNGLPVLVHPINKNYAKLKASQVKAEDLTALTDLSTGLLILYYPFY